jgi:hypothetical protein
MVGGSSNSHAGSPLLLASHYRAIRDHASGELPLVDFKHLVAFSGFVPSAGADEVANYLATKARTLGLANVSTERFSSSSALYCWAFRHEPYWEGQKGELWLVEPTLDRLADFQAIRTCLARNSRSCSVTAELIDVGSGDDPRDYEGRNVEGKVVLAHGSPSQVMRLAVWERKALGIVSYRIHAATDFPDQIGLIQLVPWIGPEGQTPTFAFSLSYRAGKGLRDRLAANEALKVHAEVEAETRSGQYPEVRAEIPGIDAELPAVLIYAHYNSRNTGGGNNLTGVGCTLEIARLLTHLIEIGALPRPRRTIRFMWGAEHYGIQYHFHENPDDIKNILAMINIDMIGYNQQTAFAVLHLYRSPYSNPSFIDDIMEAFMDQIGKENTISIRNSDDSSMETAIENAQKLTVDIYANYFPSTYWTTDLVEQQMPFFMPDGCNVPLNPYPPTPAGTDASDCFGKLRTDLITYIQARYSSHGGVQNNSLEPDPDGVNSLDPDANGVTDHPVWLQTALAAQEPPTNPVKLFVGLQVGAPGNFYRPGDSVFADFEADDLTAVYRAQQMSICFQHVDFIEFYDVDIASNFTLPTLHGNMSTNSQELNSPASALNDDPGGFMHDPLTKAHLSLRRPIHIRPCSKPIL